jgi:ABC-type multidrug transport system ATPase subunit
VSFSSLFRFLDIYRFNSSTRGLNSNTALEFVRALWLATKLVRNATIVSIYQARESLYELFDKVCLLYEGRMVLASSTWGTYPHLLVQAQKEYLLGLAILLSDVN